MRNIFISVLLVFFMLGCANKKEAEMKVNDFDNQALKTRIVYKYANEKFIKFNQFRYYEDSNKYQKGKVTNVNVVKQDTFSMADVTVDMGNHKMKTVRCMVPPVDGIYEMSLNKIFHVGGMLYFVVDKNNLASSYLVLH